MRISELCTFNDWTAHFGAWGEAGVEKVFDVLSVAGVRRVYWRGLSGGVAEYSSNVAPRLDPRKNTEIFGKHICNGGIESWHSLRGVDLDVFDPLAVAVRIGRERGISVCAWLTIYEEDHGGAHGSPLGKDPRYMQQDHRGQAYSGTADFFFPEVREYKLQVIQELIDRGVDGLLLDFVRHNATPSADENGVHRFGYNQEIREAFRALTGKDASDLPADDPAWLAFKTGYQTDFVREVYERFPASAHKALMTWGVDVKRWLALDLHSLAADGTIDLVVPVSMAYSNAPEEVVSQHRKLADQMAGTPVEVASSVATYFGIDAEDFEEAMIAAEEAGIEQIVHCESEQMITDRLTTSVRAVHLRAPRSKREVSCEIVAAEPSGADWARAEGYGGFFVATGPDRIHSSFPSEFRVVASPAAFHCRLYAHGAKKDPVRPVEEGNYDQYAERDASFFVDRKWYIDALGARLYWQGTERGHLFLDPERSRRKFCHFVADRRGNHCQQTHRDNSWQGQWKAEIQEPEENLWVADWSVPWETLGAKPARGQQWAFQIFREQAIDREVSSWFVTTSPMCAGVRPHEWGDVRFR